MKDAHGDPHVDDAHVVLEMLSNFAIAPALSAALALQQGDLFAVFAQAGEPEAEIGFVTLLREIELDESTADPVRADCPEAGIDESDPEQEAWNDKRRAGDGETRR